MVGCLISPQTTDPKYRITKSKAIFNILLCKRSQYETQGEASKLRCKHIYFKITIIKLFIYFFVSDKRAFKR